MTDRIVEILLIEDNPNDAELTLHAFKANNLGNRIHHARDGQEALDILFPAGDSAGSANHAVPRLILLDLKLPKIDGLEVLREIRTSPVTRNVPVVILTSSREERDLVESYNLGVNSYIVKPIDFNQFTEAVRAVGLYWLLLNEPAPPLPASHEPDS
jgi:two-component system response regulator